MLLFAKFHLPNSNVLIFPFPSPCHHEHVNQQYKQYYKNFNVLVMNMTQNQPNIINCCRFTKNIKLEKLVLISTIPKTLIFLNKADVNYTYLSILFISEVHKLVNNHFCSQSDYLCRSSLKIKRAVDMLCGLFNELVSINTPSLLLQPQVMRNLLIEK